MMRTTQIAIVAILIGLIGGSVVDCNIAPPPPEKRGPYTVLKGDFHAHTRLGDGFLSPIELVVAAHREGLHVVGVTEHNMVYPSFISRWASKIFGGPIVLTGAEITNRRFHILALGIEEDIDWRLDADVVVKAIHEQGGVAIVAHPSTKYWNYLEPAIDMLDGVEIMHPLAYRGNTSRTWKWSYFHQYWSRAVARGNRTAAIGNSDHHGFRALGGFHTWLFTRETSAAGVLEAIREGRTATVDLKGKVWGQPDIVELVKDHPLPSAYDTCSYAAVSAWDTCFRVIGWLGLVALLVMRRRRLPRGPLKP